jgi:hypothetical protein
LEKWSDLYNPKSRIVIELDGEHHFNNAAIKDDLLRDLYFAVEGYFILRFENAECADNLDEVISSIGEIYKKRCNGPQSLSGNFPLATFRERINKYADFSLVRDLEEEILDRKRKLPKLARGKAVDEAADFLRKNDKERSNVTLEPFHAKLWPVLGSTLFKLF